MKTRSLLLFLLLFVFVGSGQTQTSHAPDPAQWKRYTISGEEFSVTLPSLPAMASNKAFSNVVDHWRLERVLTTSAAGASYSIYACENLKRPQSLADFIADQAAKFGLDMTSESNLKVSGFPGKQYTVRDGTKFVTEQFFATEGHLYRFIAISAGADNPGVRQFLSSIALGKNQDGIAVVDGPGDPLLPDGAGKTFRRKEVDKGARITNRPEPSYTDEAKARSVRGVVVLTAILSSTGKVTDITVVSGLPYGLTQKAIEAARKIKFTPALKDGKPVSMWIQLEYNFNLY